VTRIAGAVTAAGQHARTCVYVIYDVRSQQMSNNGVQRDLALMSGAARAVSVDCTADYCTVGCCRCCC